MSVSIALCTWNGASFLREQLESILGQTRIPDEIVLRDDGSDDGTVDLARSLLSEAPCRVDIEVQPRNLGSTRNFESALKACTGDVVFFCDQDDRWDSDKIATMVDRLEAAPFPAWVFCDARIADQELTESGERFWRREGFDSRRKRKFLEGDQVGTLLSRSMVMGCALALRRDLAMRTLPIGDGWIHDEWLVLSLATRNIPGTIVDQPLQTYRTHQAQQIGPSSRERSPRGVQARLVAIEAEVRKLEGLQAALPSGGHPKVASKIVHMRARAAILAASPAVRPILAIKELLTGRYSRYSRSTLGVARDVIGI